MSHSSSVGLDSRCCFCVFSEGNPRKAIKDNHMTILHTLWEREHFFVEVQISKDESTERFSCCSILWSLASYPVGMVGYLVDTIVKIVLLIGNFFTMLIALFSCSAQWRRNRGIIFFDNLAAIGIGIIGIVVPPLAYRLDQCAKKSMLSWLENSPPETDPLSIYHIDH